MVVAPAVLLWMSALTSAAWGGVPAAAGGEPSSSSALGAVPLGSDRSAAGVHPIRRVEIDDPALAITFDACATRSQGYGFDRAVFEILKREEIPSTIFVSGRWVESHPDTMQELSRDPLVEFGDHSYDHPHMPSLAREKMLSEIDRTEAALALYGKHGVAFRPPFGEWTPRVLEVAGGRQLPTVTWDVVSGDPSLKTTTDQMIRTVVGKARSGSIIIFHINGRGWKTAEALPVIIQELRARGFRFVHLSELLPRGGHPEPALASSATPIVWTTDVGTTATSGDPAPARFALPPVRSERRPAALTPDASALVSPSVDAGADRAEP